jgi:glycosyltransferase involved in cell wall biosynthesis
LTASIGPDRLAPVPVQVQPAEARQQPGVLDRVRVGVVIPAFRAEGTIEAVLAGLPPEIAHVFVVDDASPDRTAALVESLADPRVRLLRHDTNRGVGAAVKTGYRAALEAGCDVVVKVDADGQMDPSFLPDLVRPLLTGEAGYAKGNRLWSIEASRAMPRRRLVGNLFLSLATKAASGYWNVLDPTNGFTAIRADVLRRLDWRHLDDGYFFETSVLVELHLMRVPVRDVLMPARYGGEISSMTLARVAVEFSGRLLRSLMRRIVLEYFLLDFRPGSVFGILGLILGGFGAVFGGYHWYLGATTGVSTPAGTVMVAAVPFVVGLQLLLQALLLDMTEVRNFPPLPPLA